MQTRFTESQLASADIARANDILRKCVHCGFCLATCPTYLVTGDERDSPRGRIWLIRDLLEGNTASAETTGYHLDRCLTCLSCMTTCPSGVDYMHLVDIGRGHAETHHKRSWRANFMRKSLIGFLSNYRRAYLVLLLGWSMRFLSRLAPKNISALLKLAPQTMPKLDRIGSKDTTYPAKGSSKKGRVLLLTGCAQRTIAPEINEASIALLNRLGVEVVVKGGALCCGALAHHGGEAHTAHKTMLATISAWEEELDKIDAIVINTSGCGVMVKDYGDFITRNLANEGLVKTAKTISSLTCDITELVARIGLPKTKAKKIKVAYHSSCTLQHGQKLHSLPKDLLVGAGFTVVEPDEAHICCGAAGIYNALQPELSSALRERKTAALNATGADIIASGNLGCMNQLQESAMPVVHTIELLNWASGGKKPRALSA